MKVIVVGNGIAGHNLAASLLKGSDSITVQVFSEEAFSPYYRTRVLSLLDGKTTAESLAIAPAIKDGRYSLSNLHVDNIDVDGKLVYASDGSTHSYDVLVLANGAKASRLALPGGRSRGIFAVRTIEDTEELGDWIKTHGDKPVVVIGGGLLGLEAAALISSVYGCAVTVMESADYLLPRQLDRESGVYLQKRLAALGLKILTGVNTSNFLSKNDEVTAIKCDDGFTVQASTVIESVGIRPNTFLAIDAGLRVGRAVTVDGQLRTSHEDVYAIGDVADAPGAGTAAGAMAMARTLSDVILGKDVSYTPPAAGSMLKVAGLDVITLGRVDDHGAECIVSEDGEGREAYFVKDGLLIGCTMIGKKGNMAAARAGLGKDFSSLAL